MIDQPTLEHKLFVILFISLTVLALIKVHQRDKRREQKGVMIISKNRPQGTKY
jgi:hypothetical protein